MNARDPEAVCFITRLALDWRATFHKDVVVDVIGFRRIGHSEQDEPMLTQPFMYTTIKDIPTGLKEYADKLMGEKIVTGQEASERITFFIYSFLLDIYITFLKFKRLLPSCYHKILCIIGGSHKHFKLHFVTISTTYSSIGCELSIVVLCSRFRH